MVLPVRQSLRPHPRPGPGSPDEGEGEEGVGSPPRRGWPPAKNPLPLKGSNCVECQDV